MSNDGSFFECKDWLITLEKIQNADYLLSDNIFLKKNNNIYLIIHYINSIHNQRIRRADLSHVLSAGVIAHSNLTG